MPAVEVGPLGAERGDLEGAAVHSDLHHSVLGSDGGGASEKSADLVGECAGGDVDVLGFATEQAVTHAPAGEKGLVAVTPATSPRIRVAASSMIALRIIS